MEVRALHPKAVARSAAVATSLLACALAVALAERPANASVTTVNPAPGSPPPPSMKSYQSNFDYCMNQFSKEDYSGDPRHIVAWLQFSPTLQSATVSYNSDYSFGATFTTAPGGGVGGPSLIYWNPYDNPTHSDGVRKDPCADLYHELYHAYRNARGENGPGALCVVDGNSLKYDEVDATLAENEYRGWAGLDRRSEYGGMPLPSALSDCNT